MSFHPQTPQSPSQQSPGSSDQTVASMSISITSTTSTLPTPAHSVNGSSLQLDMAHDTVMGGDSPNNKRKRHIDDHGDREQKKVQTEDRRLGIENLHLDVGEKYLLCRTRKAPFTSIHPAIAAVVLSCAMAFTSSSCLLVTLEGVNAMARERATTAIALNCPS